MLVNRVKILVDEVKKISHDIKNDDITLDTFNFYSAKVYSNIDSTSKVIKELEDII